MYNPDSHPVHQWAVKMEMLVSTWLRRMPSETGRDLRFAVEERNMRACANILAELAETQTLFLATDQLGLRDLERRLALGEFESAEQLAGRFRVGVGQAYREGRLDCSLVSDLHHFFEVQFANRVYAWEDVPEGVEVEEEEEEDEEDVPEEDYLEHKRLLSLLSMSRRIEKELGSLRMEKGWNDHSEEEGTISDQSMGGEMSENYSGKSSILQRSRAVSDESMEEDGRIGENYSRPLSRNHFVKSFQNIGILGDNNLKR